MKIYIMFSLILLLLVPVLQSGHGQVSEMPDYFAEHSDLYKIGPGRIMKFLGGPVTPCTNPNFKIQYTDLIKDPIINPDNIDNHLFVVLNEFNSDSYGYLKIELPEGDGHNRYHLMLYDQNNYAITGQDIGLENGSSKFILETASGDLIIDENERFDKFVETGNTKFGSYSTIVGPGSYNVHSFLSQYAGSSIETISCVITLDWKFSVSDDGTFSSDTPQIKTGSLVNVTDQFSIKQQKEFGLAPWSIVCKEGKSVLSQKEHFFHDGRTACVSNETKIKLIERGWNLALPTSKLTYFDKSQELEIAQKFEDFMKKQSYNNVPSAFVMGKHNFKNLEDIIHFCGEFKEVDVNYSHYFHGAIDASETLVWDGIEKQSGWCAINDDAQIFRFVYDWKLENEG